jgi:hypothetical protein
VTIKRIAQACGFAAILLLPNYIDITSSSGDSRMRFPVPLTKIAVAHLLDLAIVALVFGCAMWMLRKLKTWPTVRWALMALLPPFLFVCNLSVFPVAVPTVVALSAIVIWLAVVVVLILRAPAIAVKLRQAGSAVLAGASIFAMVITWQLIQVALWRPMPQAFAAQIPTQSATRPRLVWILFDELAYKPTFEARDPSVNLPNFDRLRSESTIYTDITPIAYRTMLVVPSLMLGRNVTGVDYTSTHHYLVQIDNSSHWTAFDANASLFGMAKRDGVTTSIVGWYVAYCPIFSGVATECYWSNRDAQDNGPTSPDASFATNVWLPLRLLTEQFTSPAMARADIAARNAEAHGASVTDVSQHALAALANSQADIIYLHLPAPHPPAFWDRRTQRFAAGGSYLDSLDYSDRLLGQMLDLLRSQPRWAGTTLIVQGDHSWRTKMWRPVPGWSSEDERISHQGEWDPRPALLIHAAGQQNTQTVTAPTSLMIVHDFVASQIQALAR